MVPLGIDKEKLQIQLGRLNDHLNELEKIKGLFSSGNKQDILISAGERILQLSIEDSLNIGSHIISGKGFKRADTYREIFDILTKEKIISSDLGEKMMGLASFRNRLVHLYWEVTTAETLEKINDTDVFRNYAKEIINLID